jgi:hypothetical protein
MRDPSLLPLRDQLMVSIDISDSSFFVMLLEDLMAARFLISCDEEGVALAGCHPTGRAEPPGIGSAAGEFS